MFRKDNMSMINYTCLLGAMLSFCFGLVFAGPNWNNATGTWYGDPEGSGSNGGACGYGPLVDVRPLKRRVTAVSPVLFKNGKGCGACYKVKCLDKTICSNKVVTVIVTDECPGCTGTHFDLSGAAFGRMALNDKGGELRNRGKLPIVYRKTTCKYRGKKIGFRVNEGSSPYWLSLLVVFEDGDGDIGALHIKPAKSNEWMPMAHSWGANWYITGKGPLEGPFSIKLTTLSSGSTLTATNVIPKDMKPGASYTCHHNFLH